MTRGVLIRGIVALVAIWGLVFAATSWSSRRKVTPEKVTTVIDASDFADWSDRDPARMGPGEKAARQARLDELVGMIEVLDLRERGEVFTNEDYWAMGAKLSAEEGQYVVDRLIGGTGKRMLEMFDQLDSKSREMMIERAIRKIGSGDGAGNLARLQKENPELVKSFINKGGKLFLEEASVKTKFALIPFLDTIRESLQGFGKPEIGDL